MIKPPTETAGGPIIDDTVSTISVINTATNKVVGSEVSLGLPAGTTALGIAIIDDEGDTCITCWDSDRLIW